MSESNLRGWWITAVAALAGIVLLIPLYAVLEQQRQAGLTPPGPGKAQFIGRERCAKCHEKAYKDWQGSHHDYAMAVADTNSVRGDFSDTAFEFNGLEARFYQRDQHYYIYSTDIAGEGREFEVAYTFGWEPLQQYLLRLPGGRLQAFSVAWNTVRSEWFFLYPDTDIPPDDWLHWSRNGQNWNGMCAECHSTNLRKNYNAEEQTYTTDWSEIDVSCEACHGPGSDHVAWAEIPPMARPPIADYGLVLPTRDLDAREMAELCAPCHSRRSEMGDYDHTSRELLDFMLPALLDEGLYHADGQILDEVYVYGSFVQSKMYHNDVGCNDCHNVHTLGRVADGNELCLKCHRADTYDSYDHHFHKKVHEGKPSPGALCVKCHMAEQPFMVVDWRADHSLRLPRPDLSSEINTPNACMQIGCHDDKPLSYSLDACRKWYGQARKPHYGQILAAGRALDPEAEDDLARLAEDPLYPAIVRATAASLLLQYPGEVAQQAFARLLYDSEPLLRHTAALNVTPPSAEVMAEWMPPLLADPVRSVRMQAANRLAEIPRELLEPYQQTALDEALDEYRGAMTAMLDFSHGGLNLGNLAGILGDQELAEHYYRTALAVDDLFFPAKINLAVLLSQMNRSTEAEPLLREIVAEYPAMTRGSYLLGLLLVELGNPEEAVLHLERAAVQMPQPARVYYNLGLLYQQLQRIEEAERSLRSAVDAAPLDLEILYGLADHYIRRRMLDEAKGVAEKMIAAHPEHPLGTELMKQLDSVGEGQNSR
jgi:tetratricopeptide (TPR) repeat protein